MIPLDYTEHAHKKIAAHKNALHGALLDTSIASLRNRANKTATSAAPPQDQKRPGIVSRGGKTPTAGYQFDIAETETLACS